MSHLERYAWPLLVASSSAAAAAVFVSDVGPPISVIVTVWFLGACPGVSLVRMLKIDDLLTVAILTIALSLSIVAVASVPLLWIGIWTPARALAVIFTITLGGATAEVWSIGRPATVPVEMVTIPPRPEGPPPMRSDG
jgi:hypothetical protein